MSLRSILVSVILLFLPNSSASTTTSLPNVTCSINGNDTCLVTRKTISTIPTTNQSITWRIQPSNIGFNYYLRTSDNGDDLGVRGLLKFKIPLKNWAPSINQPQIDGFSITIVDADANKVIGTFEVEIGESFEKLRVENEIIQIRLQFDDTLTFGKKYFAKVHLLPFGVQSLTDSSTINIVARTVDKKCSANKGLAERWAPRVIIDVFEATAALNVSWRLAPSFLCIKSYTVAVFNVYEMIINKSEVEVDGEQTFGHVSFLHMPRKQFITVKVRASSSTDGNCACHQCNCLTDKTKPFVIPKLGDIPGAPLILFNSSSPSEVDESNFEVFCVALICICFAVTAFILLCFIARKYNAGLKHPVLLKTFNRTEKPGAASKKYKVLLVCSNAVADEDLLMQRICQGFRDSNNRVVCDKFEEFSTGVEQNMLQWIYRETTDAEKIVLLHSSSHDSGVGVYDVLTACLPFTDRRLVHVLLSTKVQLDMPTETKYILPRDGHNLENAFNMTIPLTLANEVVKAPPDEIVLIPEENIEELPDCQPYSLESNSYEDCHKTRTIDSGVSSMNSDNGNSQDFLSDTINVTVEMDEKSDQIERHPLLQYPMIV